MNGAYEYRHLKETGIKMMRKILRNKEKRRFGNISSTVHIIVKLK